ncbi:hypothetical protein BD410DRAFT_809371 [Rickenella mellea]|uniref:Uncharacterized protein n=1 Tax=Rickenella mellea TaxID=50990 RepID=A0A4Y7PJ79_9AGAM|nr:hypothetical protein BD410DRAFT_809371 [Rickenella mellea]
MTSEYPQLTCIGVMDTNGRPDGVDNTKFEGKDWGVLKRALAGQAAEKGVQTNESYRTTSSVGKSITLCWSSGCPTFSNSMPSKISDRRLADEEVVEVEGVEVESIDDEMRPQLNVSVIEWRKNDASNDASTASGNAIERFQGTMGSELELAEQASKARWIWWTVLLKDNNRWQFKSTKIALRRGGFAPIIVVLLAVRRESSVLVEPAFDLVGKMRRKCCQSLETSGSFGTPNNANNNHWWGFDNRTASSTTRRVSSAACFTQAGSWRRSSGGAANAKYRESILEFGVLGFKLKALQGGGGE